MADADEADSRALAIAARGGDEAAFAELVRRYADRLWRFLISRGVGAEDAQDVVQETFLRAWRAIDRYDERWAPSTWLYTIAQRLALNARARQARRAQVPLADEALPAPDAEEPREAPAGALWATARSLLGERDFAALRLYYAEEQDMRGVARVLGVSALHARVIVHRARARLAKLITVDGAVAGVAQASR